MIFHDFYETLYKNSLPGGLKGVSTKKTRKIQRPFSRGSPKRGNPKMTTSTVTAKRKETLNIMLREKSKFSQGECANRKSIPKSMTKQYQEKLCNKHETQLKMESPRETESTITFHSLKWFTKLLYKQWKRNLKRACRVVPILQCWRLQFLECWQLQLSEMLVVIIMFQSAGNIYFPKLLTSIIFEMLANWCQIELTEMLTVIIVQTLAIIMFQNAGTYHFVEC